MPDDKPTQEPTKEQELTAELDATKAKLARAESIAGLPSEQLALFKSLDGPAQDEFLKADEAARKQRVADAAKAAADADPVVYKADDGTEFRKSDDPRLVKMAQDRDEDRKTLKAERARAETATYEKRAGEELPNLAGDAPARAALLKAVDSIEDEKVREAATKALKSANEAAAGAFRRSGEQGAPDLEESSPEAQLEALARKRVEKSAGATPFETAYQEVLETEEGQRLYAEIPVRS